MHKTARLLLAVVVAAVSVMAAWVDDGESLIAAPTRACHSRLPGPNRLRRRRRRIPAVVYLPDPVGNHDTVDDADLLRQAAELCSRRGLTEVAVVRGLHGYIQALQMVEDGEADWIVTASRDLLPDVVVSPSGEIPGLPTGNPPAVEHTRRRSRRIWPIQRGDAEA